MLRHYQLRDLTNQRERKNPGPSGNNGALISTAVIYKANRYSNNGNSVSSCNEDSSKAITFYSGDLENAIQDKTPCRSIEEIDPEQVSLANGCSCTAKYKGWINVRLGKRNLSLKHVYHIPELRLNSKSCHCFDMSVNYSDNCKWSLQIKS